jgi:hypothetical protein
MIAYKFRSENQFAFALDILFNQRLYCADWSTLNDPMEGAFVYSSGPGQEDARRREIEAVIREKQQLRVSSLSRTFDCHLLWAHYASGFSGLALEIELPDRSSHVREVKYGGIGAVLPRENMNPVDAASLVLSSKFREWEYEREVRVLYNQEWYRLPNPVRRVIAGHRMNRALFRALAIVCKSLKVPLAATGIGDEGIDADRVPDVSEWNSETAVLETGPRRSKSART